MKAEKGKYVKVRIRDGGNAERMWFIVEYVEDGVIHGRLDNDPFICKNIKAGDIHKFSEDDIIAVYEE